MTIAYLIAAHDNPPGLSRLIQSLRAPNTAFFVHIDAKVDIGPFYANVPVGTDTTFIDNRCAVHWGGWSQVQATLNMIEAAVRAGQHARYILLSGACLPLANPAALHAFFDNNPDEYINCRPFPDHETEKPWSRLAKWYFEGGDRAPGLRARVRQVANTLAKALPDRRVDKLLGDYLPYGGTNWWALSADAIAAIRHCVATRPDLVRLYRHSKCPDESFFQTIVANALGTHRLKRCLMYSDWSNPAERPAFLTSGHLRALHNGGMITSDPYGTGPVLFGRKFGVRNSHVADEVLAGGR